MFTTIYPIIFSDMMKLCARKWNEYWEAYSRKCRSHINLSHEIVDVILVQGHKKSSDILEQFRIPVTWHNFDEQNPHYKSTGDYMMEANPWIGIWIE